MTQILELCWYGPYGLYETDIDSVFITNLSDQKGIYLWTVPIEKKYLTYYVGETGRSFATRFVEHTKDVLNGFYHIYDPSQFSKGRKTLIWGGMWKPDRKSPSTMLEFLNRYIEMAPQLLEFLRQLRFFLAPTNAEKRIRQRAEAAIAKRLLDQPGLIGGFQDDDIKYWPRRVNEEPILLKMKSFEPVLGLCSELPI